MAVTLGVCPPPPSSRFCRQTLRARMNFFSAITVVPEMLLHLHFVRSRLDPRNCFLRFLLNEDGAHARCWFARVAFGDAPHEPSSSLAAIICHFTVDARDHRSGLLNDLLALRLIHDGGPFASA
jgi:hypothetical protein